MRVLLSLIFSVGLCACASTGGASRKDVKSVTITLKGRDGETGETRYFSNAHILTYQDGQLLRDRLESVDFTVRTDVTKYDTDQKTIAYSTRTVRKDGTVPLHDLAFPEINEQIDYVVRTDGQVLKAGQFGARSLFFVPSMPIPDQPVEVGDTWTMEHTWFSAKEGIPLKLDVVGILKDIVSCEGGRTCADLEISGHVNLVAAPTAQGAHFESRLWGRMLFSIDRGDVIWSEMRSHEEMGVQSDRMVVSSCMISETKLGAKFKTDFACDPEVRPVNQVPKL
jgi:hypothetical protein